MSGALTDLCDKFSVGLVLLDKDGHVRYANRAARERFGAVDGSGVCAPIRSTLLRWREQGYVSGACSVSLPAPCAAHPDERMFVDLYEGLLDGESALLIRATPEGEWSDRLAQLLFVSVSMELRGALHSGIASLALATRSMQACSRPQEATVQPLAPHCDQADASLDWALADLTQRVDTNDGLVVDETDRCAIGAVLTGAASSVQGFYARRSVTLTGSAGPEHDLDVEGSGLVMRVAFGALLRAAAHGVPSGSTVHFSVRSEDSRMLVRVVSTPPPGGERITRDFAFSPLLTLAQRLFEEIGGSVTSVSSVRRASSGYLVSLRMAPVPVRRYLGMLAQVEHQSAELVRLTLQRIAARASRPGP